MSIKALHHKTIKAAKRAEEPELEQVLRDYLFELQEELARSHGRSRDELRHKVKTLDAYWREACKVSERDGVAYSPNLFSGLLVNLVSNPNDAKQLFEIVGIQYDEASIKAARRWVEDNWTEPAAIIGATGETAAPSTDTAADDVLRWRCSAAPDADWPVVWVLNQLELLVYHPFADWELRVQLPSIDYLDALVAELRPNQVAGLRRGLAVTVASVGAAADLLEFLIYLTEVGRAIREVK